MTSIKDVAEAAGVSTATVSRVLSNKPHVSDELRQRVLLAVERLDYRPNLIARSLRTRQSDTIGLVVADIRNPYFTAVSRAVEDMAYEQGISVYLCNTDEDPHKEALYLQVLRKENVAGIIFSPTRKSEQDLQGFDIPTVAIDRPVRSAQVDSVLIDNFDAAYKLTEHLIQNGYRRISALFGAASSTGRERRRGFEQALNDHDLQIPSPGLVNYVQPKVGSGREAALEMLAASPPPQAIFTSNSLLTAGALMAMREKGLRIPEDIGLVGFDDTTWSALVEPGITVISQPTDDIGRTATELLLQRISNPERAAREVILKGKLVVRGSSAPRKTVQQFESVAKDLPSDARV
ncbi:MAG: LacI family DNA-binding transcriptional regulator [Anaerolineales bacterium]|jgi:LacI family fructose operon transcriptional repressor